MNTILSFIHGAIQVIVAIASLLLVDLPLKVISTILITAFAVIVYVFYPITKKIKRPKWVISWIEYATSIEIFLTTKIAKAWN